MMTAIEFMFRRYALGIIPFPNRYVTWFEHIRPITITRICAGTSEKMTMYHRSSTVRSKSMYGALHPGNRLRA